MSDETRRHLEEAHGHLDEAANQGNTDAGDMREQLSGYMSKETPSDDDHKDILESLGDSARRFEVEHPSLSRTLQTVIDSLTAAGI
jgi:hypothetical protein